MMNPPSWSSVSSCVPSTLTAISDLPAGAYEGATRLITAKLLKGPAPSPFSKIVAKGVEAAKPVPSSGGLGGILDSLGLPGGNGGSAPRGRTRETPLEAAAKSAARAMGSEVGRRIIRGVLGSILGGKR